MGGPRSIEADCFLGAVSALIAMGRREELLTYLRRIEEDDLKRAERAALIPRLCFYAGFRAAINALAIADATVSQALVPRRSTWIPWRNFTVHQRVLAVLGAVADLASSARLILDRLPTRTSSTRN
jgi:hypothetical protein